MPETLSYVLAGIVLSIANLMAWGATWFGLPGTWVIVAASALACHFFPSRGALGLGWWTVGVLAALAALGELWETGYAAAAARKAGASRRGASFAMLGSIVGGLGGGLLGLPIPIVGPMLAAIVGAAGGAFVGAWIGERPRGIPLPDRLLIGGAAAKGRVWGTVGKIVIGFLMVIVASLGYFL